MLYVSNAFSLSMLENAESILHVETISHQEAVRRLKSSDFQSAVGHESTAKVISQLTGVQVPTNRIKISLKPNDLLLVFQLKTRLPEGRLLTMEEVQQMVRERLFDWRLVRVMGVEA